MTNRFWETKSLTEMTRQEWESICDGCARCCLMKLEDEEDGSIYYTDVACSLLELNSCRCQDYANRTVLILECVRLTPEHLDDLWMMPPSCSYRRLAEGRGLPEWHHLISGNADDVHKRGWSVKGSATPVQDIPKEVDLEDRLVDWPVLDCPVTPNR